MFAFGPTPSDDCVRLAKAACLLTSLKGASALLGIEPPAKGRGLSLNLRNEPRLCAQFGNNGNVRVVLGMGEADCDFARDLHRYHIYTYRDLVVALEVARHGGSVRLTRQAGRNDPGRLCVGLAAAQHAPASPGGGPGPTRTVPPPKAGAPSPRFYGEQQTQQESPAIADGALPRRRAALLTCG